MEEKEIIENKEKIITLLKSAIDDEKASTDLINYMEKNEYFISPASTVFHGNYIGGLALHSLNIFDLFIQKINKFKLQEKISSASAIKCAILHDLCKAGMYIDRQGRFKYNDMHPKGHALLSISRIEKFITLTPLEKEIIKYHMGYYGTTEFNGRGEYSIQELCNANNNPITKLFHWCDDMESQFM